MAKRNTELVRGLSASDCMTAIRDKFEARAYAVLEQVANGTGWKADRWADAVAFSLWPSRGLTLHGFEIKISRQDWKKELADPAKSAGVQSYCDHWWIVAPRGLVPVDDLPATWGLLEVDEKRKLAVKKQAPELPAKPLDRAIVAALLRRVADAQCALMRRERAAGHEDGAKEGDPETARKLESVRGDLKQLTENVEAFEKASGVSIARAWNAGDIGQAVRAILDTQRLVGMAERMRAESKSHLAIAKTIDEQIAKLDALQTDRSAAE